MLQKNVTSLQATIEYQIDQVANARQRHAVSANWPLYAYRHTATSVKYAEGRLVALTRVRRMLRRLREMPEQNQEVLLQIEMRNWAALLAGYRHLDVPTSELVDYARGGVDAIFGLLSAFEDMQAA